MQFTTQITIFKKKGLIGLNMSNCAIILVTQKVFAHLQQLRSINYSATEKEAAGVKSVNTTNILSVTLPVIFFYRTKEMWIFFLSNFPLFLPLIVNTYSRWGTNKKNSQRFMMVEILKISNICVCKQKLKELKFFN